MTILVRFAPSPTGRLHVGNVKAAIVNWLFARARGGRFQLRIDDTDAERSTEAYRAAISRDLAWLGLDWDECFRQSDRLDRYAAAAEALKAAGRLYPCYETPDELERQRRRARARGRPPIYDRAALGLGADDIAALEATGRRPHWRFQLEPGPIAWPDLIRGPVRFEAAALSDPVLIRADGRPLYTLSSVVDDGETGVSHVIRGEDHVTNTAAQAQLFQALGFPVPAFGHFALLVGADGEPLGKRLGGLTIEALRRDGVEPLAILSLLARLGTSDPVEARASLADLVAGFDIARFGRAAARFDPIELEHVNARVLHLLPFEAVADRLRRLGLADADAAFWLAVRPNLTRLSDALAWHRVIEGPIEPEIVDPDFTAAAARLLPDGPFDPETWKSWTGAVKTATGAKGRDLFRPLRLALTGVEHGPEMKNLLPLIGRARAAARLSGEKA